MSIDGIKDKEGKKIKPFRKKKKKKRNNSKQIDMLIFIDAFCFLEIAPSNLFGFSNTWS